MTEKEKAQHVAEIIEQEGFDYAFRHYLSDASIPESLKEKVKAYTSAAEAIEEGLVELGADPDLIF